MRNQGVLRGAAVVGFAGVLGAGGCTTNEATGRSQFTALMPLSAQIATGEQLQPQFVAEYGGEVSDAGARRYVTEIGQKLAVQTEADYPDLPWEFTLLDSDVLNAFALPGGKVFISRGLAQRFDSEAELAFVLGHEVGHVTAQHTVDRMNREYLKAGGAALIGVAAQSSDSAWAQLGGQVLIGAGGVYAMSYDRDQESESDTLGIRYMTRAGYNPIGALGAMQVLADEAGGGGSPEFLSTHPHPETRLGRIEAILRAEHPKALEDRTSDTWPDRYRSRLLSRLAAGPDGAPDAGAPAAPAGRRMGIAALGARLAHEGADAADHALAWCLLCTKQQDEAVREAMTAER